MLGKLLLGSIYKGALKEGSLPGQRLSLESRFIIFREGIINKEFFFSFFLPPFFSFFLFLFSWLDKKALSHLHFDDDEDDDD